jgi:short-subunit dehydrogenase
MKTAWVVGASSALGGATATRLRKERFAVVSLSRTEPAPGVADTHVRCDVTDLAEVERAVASALAIHGAPSVVVYAAGQAAMGVTFTVPMDMARRAFAVNFWGLDAVVRGVLPAMHAAGGGTIVAILSLAAHRAITHEAYYSASKAAALRWLDCVALEAHPLGVHIKHLSPGFIDTGFFDRGGWHGMNAPPVRGSGVTPDDVAEEVWSLTRGKRSSVIGWRERAIVLADRLSPGAYDALVRWRHK